MRRSEADARDQIASTPLRRYAPHPPEPACALDDIRPRSVHRAARNMEVPMTTKNRIRTGSLLLALLVVMLCGSAARSQPGPIDPQHYWTWSLLEPRFQPDSAAFRDQFIPEYRVLNPFRLDRLLNPVEKTHDGLFPIRD